MMASSATFTPLCPTRLTATVLSVSGGPHGRAGRTGFLHAFEAGRLLTPPLVDNTLQRFTRWDDSPTAMPGLAPAEAVRDGFSSQVDSRE